MACELYCCLLPQCEALRICRSEFPIATQLTTMMLLIWRKQRLTHCLQPLVPGIWVCDVSSTRFPAGLVPVVGVVRPSLARHPTAYSADVPAEWHQVFYFTSTDASNHNCQHVTVLNCFWTAPCCSLWPPIRSEILAYSSVQASVSSASSFNAPDSSVNSNENLRCYQWAVWLYHITAFTSKSSLPQEKHTKQITPKKIACGKNVNLNVPSNDGKSPLILLRVSTSGLCSACLSPRFWNKKIKQKQLSFLPQSRFQALLNCKKFLVKTAILNIHN